MTVTDTRPQGVHFVGSISLPTAEDCFKNIVQALPGRIRRIPDGETGVRRNWIGFQRDVFAKFPTILRGPGHGYKSLPPEGVDLPEGIVDFLETLQTGYDDYAIESYNTFCRLRREGAIPEGIRFQVCLPTVTAVLSGFLNPKHSAIIEPYYEKALFRALRRIQNTIPPQDLAIQFDIAGEIAILENIQPIFVPYFSPLEEGVHERMQRCASLVDEGVELGFHLCYGDLGHEHFVQPKDTELLVRTINTIVARCSHKIAWIHLPVPKDRDDDEYFAPLRGLALDPETELYLGLVHGWDEAGTKNRIAAASKIVQRFGVSTECGFGRFGKGELDSVLEISNAVSEPWA